MITINSDYLEKKLPIDYEEPTTFTVKVTYDPLTIEEDIYEPEIVYNGTERGYVSYESMEPTGEEGEYEYEFTVDAPTSTDPMNRVFTIKFSYYNEEEEDTEIKDAVFFQSNYYIPIWNDFEINLPVSATEISYKIELINGTEIYNGRAVRSPEGTFNLKVSRLIDSYLEKAEWTTSYPTIWADGKCLLQVIFKRKVGSEYVPYSFLEFVWDWSYVGNNIITENRSLNLPINGHMTATGRIPYAVFNPERKRYKLKKKYADGSSTTIGLQYSDKDNAYFYEWFTDGAISCTLLDTSNNVAGPTYDLTYHGQYTVYYRNRYGMFDAFLFEGGIKETDNYTRGSVENTERDKYYIYNDIKATYALTTAFMTDEESKRFVEYLLPSTETYLRNNETGEIIPVNITNSSSEVKIFKTNGRKFAQYTVTFERRKTQRIK